MNACRLTLCSLALAGNLTAHHGQDFLVTLDSKPLEPATFLAITRSEFSSYDGDDEFSFAQSIVAGLPWDLSLGAIIYAENDGQDFGDNGLSLTPTLQWSPGWARAGDLSFSLAAAWEFPLRDRDGHSHSDSGDVPADDCSALIGIPYLYQACLDANENRANHSHGDEHEHRGIHRHGESHGSLRLVGEWEATESDKVAANVIAVIPEDGSAAFGYAVAYRHEFTHSFGLGVEATGDFDSGGEHLALLTATWRPTHEHTLLLGAGRGFGEEAADFSIVTSFNWRF